MSHEKIKSLAANLTLSINMTEFHTMWDLMIRVQDEAREIRNL